VQLEEDRIAQSINDNWIQALQIEHYLGLIQFNIAIALHVLLLGIDQSHRVDVILGLGDNFDTSVDRPVVAAHVILIRVVLQDLYFTRRVVLYHDSVGEGGALVFLIYVACAVHVSFVSR
jgi:hypothetical protein